MEKSALTVIYNTLKVEFDKIIEQNQLDYKDEIKLLSMLLDDTSKKTIGSITISSTNHRILWDNLKGDSQK